MPFDPNKREYRSMPVLTPNDGEDDRKIIRGYATTFEQPYELFSDEKDIVKEVVSKDAFTDCLMNDVVLQYNHGGFVYARNKNGSLLLKPDDHGLFTEAELKSKRGEMLYDDIRLALITQMSFGFIVGNGNDEWDHEEIDKLTGRRIHLRRINRIKKLFDVSVVDFPANENTEVLAVRNYCNGVIAEYVAECEKRTNAERQFEQEKQRAIMRARILQNFNGGK